MFACVIESVGLRYCSMFTLSTDVGVVEMPVASVRLCMSIS
jgi:hypothetical protein